METSMAVQREEESGPFVVSVMTSDRKSRPSSSPASGIQSRGVIGVLAVQGGFAEHVEKLRACFADFGPFDIRLVKTSADLYVRTEEDAGGRTRVDGNVVLETDGGTDDFADAVVATSDTTVAASVARGGDTLSMIGNFRGNKGDGVLPASPQAVNRSSDISEAKLAHYTRMLEKNPKLRKLFERETADNLHMADALSTSAEEQKLWQKQSCVEQQHDEGEQSSCNGHLLKRRRHCEDVLDQHGAVAMLEEDKKKHRVEVFPPRSASSRRIVATDVEDRGRGEIKTQNATHAENQEAERARLRSPTSLCSEDADGVQFSEGAKSSQVGRLDSRGPSTSYDEFIGRRSRPSLSATVPRPRSSSIQEHDHSALPRTRASLRRSESRLIDGLILPGGESTAMTIIGAALRADLLHYIHQKRRPVWGTCAGCILLAEQVTEPREGGGVELEVSPPDENGNHPVLFDEKAQEEEGRRWWKVGGDKTNPVQEHLSSTGDLEAQDEAVQASTEHNSDDHNLNFTALSTSRRPGVLAIPTLVDVQPASTCSSDADHDVAARTESAPRSLFGLKKYGASLGGLPVRVRRNYFGRQVDSFSVRFGTTDTHPAFRGQDAIFIRAPVIEKILDDGDDHGVDDKNLSPASSVAPPSTSTTTRGSVALQTTLSEKDKGHDGPQRIALEDASRSRTRTTSRTQVEVQVLATIQPPRSSPSGSGGRGKSKSWSSSRSSSQSIPRGAAARPEENLIVAVRAGHVLGTCFHPELVRADLPDEDAEAPAAEVVADGTTAKTAGGCGPPELSRSCAITSSQLLPTSPYAHRYFLHDMVGWALLKKEAPGSSSAATMLRQGEARPSRILSSATGSSSATSAKIMRNAPCR
ncbi:unnamed protein product [Amoebophrya sp. A120]|nr:unnamed protein product [Amoebophrya sp. A120]|eukprot:GSA120T00022809001.1